MTVATRARHAAETRQRCFVAATPDQTYQAIWDADLAHSRVARLLSSIAGRTRTPRSVHLADMLTRGSPWILLEDDRHTSVVLGLLWRPPFGAAKCDAADFAGCAEPGFAKAVWTLRVVPFGAGHALLTSETLTLPTDRHADLLFRLVWPFMSLFAALLRRRVLQAIALHAIPA